jgi:Fic family protein
VEVPSPSRQASLAELCLLNMQVRGTPEGFGLRTVEVRALSRDDRPILFAPPESIHAHLTRALAVWDASVARARDPHAAAAACARFWMTYVAIHPFLDGNGETGRRFLARELGRRGMRLTTFAFLDRCLIEGEPESDLGRLTAVFLLSLDLASPAFAQENT